jgi:hypothetical protein
MKPTALVIAALAASLLGLRGAECPKPGDPITFTNGFGRRVEAVLVTNTATEIVFREAGEVQSARLLDLPPDFSARFGFDAARAAASLAIARATNNVQIAAREAAFAAQQQLAAERRLADAVARELEGQRLIWASNATAGAFVKWHDDQYAKDHYIYANFGGPPPMARDCEVIIQDWPPASRVPSDDPFKVRGYPIGMVEFAGQKLRVFTASQAVALDLYRKHPEWRTRK